VTQLRYVSVIYYSIFREKRAGRCRLAGNCRCSTLDVALNSASLPALRETGCRAKALVCPTPGHDDLCGQWSRNHLL